MEKEQYRFVIRFLFLGGKSRSEIKERLDAVYGDTSPSMATVKNWFKVKLDVVARRFLMSHAQVSRKRLPRRINVTKIHGLVLADRRLKIREIAETVGMSKKRVGHILHEILGMRKLSARWVPRLLTPDNKRNRETTSERCLTLFKRNPKKFLRRPLVHTRDQGTVKTVDITRRTCSDEGEDCPIGRKGDGHRFLGLTRCDLHRLPVEGQNGHRAVLCRIIGPTHRRIAENTAPLGEEKVLFHHVDYVDLVEKKITTFPKCSFFFWRLSTYRTTLVYCILIF